MSLFGIQRSTFDYQNGEQIAFSVRIDEKVLSQLVWKAAKNKNGKKIDGALLIEAKRLNGPLPECLKNELEGT